MSERNRSHRIGRLPITGGNIDIYPDRVSIAYNGYEFPIEQALAGGILYHAGRFMEILEERLPLVVAHSFVQVPQIAFEGLYRNGTFLQDRTLFRIEFFSGMVMLTYQASRIEGLPLIGGAIIGEGDFPKLVTACEYLLDYDLGSVTETVDDWQFEFELTDKVSAVMNSGRMVLCDSNDIGCILLDGKINEGGLTSWFKLFRHYDDIKDQVGTESVILPMGDDSYYRMFVGRQGVVLAFYRDWGDSVDHVGRFIFGDEQQALINQLLMLFCPANVVLEDFQDEYFEEIGGADSDDEDEAGSDG